MEAKRWERYHTLTKHFSAACRVPVTLVDSAERTILCTEDGEGNFFCGRCPNRCRLLSTMLYGCNEARRWNGRYVYYCPIGLTFFAVQIPETDCTAIAGPVIMGEVQDTLLDLPEHIDKADVSGLFTCSVGTLNHLAVLLEMAAHGLHFSPEAASFDRNVIPGEETEAGESAGRYSSFPYLSGQEEELAQAVDRREKGRARAVLNQLLHYVYSPHPDQLALIKSRAVHLVYLLARLTAAGEGGAQEAAVYRTEYLPELKEAPSLEELDLAMTRVLYHFMDYTFDFSEIKHSDAIYRIMEYVKLHYGEKITLEEIAAHVHLSASHISGMFRRETGQTISAYVSHVRIEKSKTLLLRPGVPIAEIAGLCGFEDQSYFTRVFKKQAGISPKQYRNSALGEL